MSDDPLPEDAPISQAEVDAINAEQWEGQAVWGAGVPGAAVITVPAPPTTSRTSDPTPSSRRSARRSPAAEVALGRNAAQPASVEVRRLRRAVGTTS